MNLLQKFEQKHIAEVTEGKEIPEFRAGDTVKIMVKIVEGTVERLQAYQGLVLSRKSRGLGSTFTVKKDSHGQSIERVFPLYSPRVASIEVIKRGVVRRAKLYYMRELTGKAARIKERIIRKPSAVAAKASKKVEAKAAAKPKAEKKVSAKKEEK